MNDELLKQLDACRGSDELAADEQFAQLRQEVAGSQETRELFERAQQLDARFQQAVQQDADVPLGLESRLLLALSHAAEEQASQDTEPASAAVVSSANSALVEPPPAANEPAADVVAQSPTVATKISRRRWLLPAVATTVAAAVVAFAFLPSGDSNYSSDEVADGVHRSYGALIASDGDWLQSAAPEGFELPTTWVQARSMGWKYAAVLGQRAVVHDLMVVDPRSGNQVFGHLYVLDCQSTAPPTPPRSPQRTGAPFIGVWHSGSHTYALAVSGSLGDYRMLLRPARPTV